MEKINETKSWIFKKINKIDKYLVGWTKKMREKPQFTKIRCEGGGQQSSLRQMLCLYLYWLISLG